MRRTIVLATLIAAAPLPAQMLTGTVRDSANGAVIPAVVVSLYGTGDSVLGRAVSDLRGFSIRIVDGTTRVQFRRIGYLPQFVPYTADLRGPLDVTLGRLPVRLAPVVRTARRDKQCEDGTDNGEALSFWDEVRSSLLATHLGRQIPANVTLLGYQRPANGGIQRVVRTDNPGALRAFGAAAAPDKLAYVGYVRHSGDGTVFLAPDELVLLDDSFLETHCFTAVSRNNRDSTITIRFSSLIDKPIPDIAGEVVLRQDPLELRRVTYRYTGLSRNELRARPGGSLEFQAMPNGIPMMHRYEIRAVSAARISSNLGFPGEGRPRSTGAMVIPWESGSLIERFEVAGFPPFQVTFGDVTGRISGRSRTLDGFRVDLADSPYRASTNDAGEFRITSVLPGEYVFQLRDTVYGSFGVVRTVRKRIQVGAGPTKVDGLDLPDLDDLIDRACREDGPHNPQFADVQGQGIVLARVDSGRFPTSAVPFTATLHPDPRVPVSQTKTVKGTTTSGGFLRLCNFPVRRRVTITVTLPDGTTSSASAQVEDGMPNLVTIRQRPGG
jgi:hypothetical protein